MTECITLPSGVRIAYEHVSGSRSVAIGFWVGVGSRFEKLSDAGSAHFIEHMLFKGTSAFTAAELASEMDSVGGQFNAFTTRDSTCFYARVLDSHFRHAVRILTDMLFRSLFKDDDVINERNVILDEISMYEDTPEDLVSERLMARCFPGQLGRPVLGNPKALMRCTGASLQAFMRRNYTPDRIVISVCGSFSEADLSYVSTLFSDYLSVGTPDKARLCEYKKVLTAKKKNTEQNQLCIAWPGISEGSELRFTSQIMSAILGGGLSSRLFQNIREKYGLCYSIGTFSVSYKETGLFGVSTAVSEENELRSLRLILDEIHRFCNDGISTKELERARELINANLIMAMESTSSRMNRLGASVLQLGHCLSIEDIIERYNSVTKEDILAFSRSTFKDQNMSLSALGHVLSIDEYASVL